MKTNGGLTSDSSASVLGGKPLANEYDDNDDDRRCPTDTHGSVLSIHTHIRFLLHIDEIRTCVESMNVRTALIGAVWRN